MKYLPLLLLIAGCAPLTEEEQEQREYVRVENEMKWERCQRIYKAIGTPTHSKHAHHKGRRHRPDEVKEDLMTNNCESILKRAGWE